MAPIRPTSLLGEMFGHFEQQGWPVTDLARFRMELDEDPDDDPEDDDPAGTDDVEKLKGALAKERLARRQAQKAAKEGATALTELQELKDRDKTETERAIEAAKAEGRQSALTESGQRLAAAEIKAALAGVVPDPKAIVEDLNLSKYVTDDGDVDEAAVTALRDKYAALSGGKKPPSFDGGAKDTGHDGGGSFLSKALREKRTA